MRFLADVGVSVSTAQKLRQSGHDVLHLSECALHRVLVIVEDNRYRLRRLPIQGFE